MNRTLFTVVVVVILLILVGIVSYRLGDSHTLGNLALNNTDNSLSASPSSSDRLISPTASASASPVASTPSQAVISFYDWFSTCSRQAGTNCSYNNLSYVDAPKLISNLAPKVTKGINPVFCSQNIPVSVSVSRATTPVNNTATVYLTESFTSVASVSVIVDTQLENNQWKIINVTCPVK